MTHRRPPEALLGTLLDGAEVGIAVIGADHRFRYVNDRIAAINGLPADEHVGRTIRDVLPGIAAPLERMVAQVLATGEHILSAIVTGSTAAAADRHWEASYLPIETEDGPAVGAVVVDVTERMDAVGEAQRRVRQNLVIADLGQRALRSDGVEDVLFRAAEAVRTELGADFTGVLLCARDAHHLVMRAGAGFPPEAMGTLTAESGHGSMAGYTMFSDDPVITQDATTEQRFRFTAALLEHGVRSAISTPVPGELAPVGVFGALSREPGHFTEPDAGFVRAVAHIIGAAVQNDDQRRRLQELAAQRGRLVAQALEAGEREQRQLADVLHDDVLQHLLFAQQELAGQDADGALRALGSVRRAAELVRSVAASLHPVTLSHAGLEVAVARVASEHADRGGLEIVAHVDPGAAGREDRLLISLVRELLNNVVKHAGARRAEVSIRLSAGGGIELDVTDDGCGIGGEAVAEAARRGNLGLAYARERVEALGGTMAIAAGPGGRGSSIAVAVPARRAGQRR